MNNKPYVNEYESLEREPLPEGVGSDSNIEAEERFSAEFGAFLSSKEQSSEAQEVSKGTFGTIFFGSIEERVNTFNNIDDKPSVVEEIELKKVDILGPIANVVSEKTVKQTVDASKLISKSIFDLFKEYVFFSTSKDKKKDPQQLEKEVKQNDNKRSFFDSLRRVGSKNVAYELRMKDGAEQVSRKLGGNLSYEGTLHESMEVRVDIEALMNKKNSELNAQELSAKRARAVQAASGGKKSHRVAVRQEMNPEKGINAGQRNAYTQAG